MSRHHSAGSLLGLSFAFVLLLLPVISTAGPPVDAERGEKQYDACLAQLGASTDSQIQSGASQGDYQTQLTACLTASGAATPEQEAFKKIRVSQDVQALGSTPFGEQINLYSGSLSFQQVDIDAPGNGLPIQLIRNLSVSERTTGYDFEAGTIPANGFVDWSLAIPHIQTLSAQPNPGVNRPWWFVDASEGGAQRCTQLYKPPDMTRFQPTAGGGPVTNRPIDPFQARWVPETWWHGYQLVIPGAGSQDILKRGVGNSLTPAGLTVAGQTPDASFPYTTKSLWAIGCLSATSNGVPGEGFVAVSPDGTKYWLDHLVEYPAQSLTSPDVALPLTRETVMLYVSKVEDRFHNTLIYTYNPDDTLNSITASDGRKLEFQWEAWHTGDPYNGPFHHIVKAVLQPGSADERTWTYHYTTPISTHNIPRLQSVVRPDGRNWQFDLDDLLGTSTSGATTFYQQNCSIQSNGNPNYGSIHTGTITTPSGLTGTFDVQIVVRGRSNVVHDCEPFPGANNDLHPVAPPLFAQPSIVEKSISGAGVPARSWIYTYSDPHGSYTEDCVNGCPDTVYTEVNNPGNHTTRSTFSNRYDASESLLQKVEVHASGSTSATLRTETHAYAFSGPWPPNFGFSYQDGLNLAQNEHLSRENERQIVQDGDTYTWRASDGLTTNAFNNYGQVTRTTRDNSADSQAALIETDTYKNDTANWVLGLPLNTQANMSTGETVSQNIYNSLVYWLC